MLESSRKTFVVDWLGGTGQYLLVFTLFVLLLINVLFAHIWLFGRGPNAVIYTGGYAASISDFALTFLAVIIGALLAGYVSALENRYNARYVESTNSIYLTKGYFFKRSTDVPMQNIFSIWKTQTVAGRLFNVSMFGMMTGDYRMLSFSSGNQNSLDQLVYTINKTYMGKALKER